MVDMLAENIDGGGPTQRYVRPAKEYISSSATDDWRTPPYILDLVVKVMGEIDLDPAAHPTLNTPAKYHYTKDMDGLSLDWDGRVYLNPPYGRSLPRWIAKLKAEIAAERCTEAIVLVAARVETEWFQYLWTAPVIGFLRRRVQFIDGSGYTVAGTTFPSALVYFGPAPWKFVIDATELAHCTYPCKASHIRALKSLE